MFASLGSTDRPFMVQVIGESDIYCIYIGVSKESTIVIV